MNTKCFFIAFLFLSLFSCSRFSTVSKHCIKDTKDGYIRIKNQEEYLSSLTYGDFDFAFRRKDYKQINSDDTKLQYKDIIYYAKTRVSPHYDYYLTKETSYKTSPSYQVYNYSFYQGSYQLIISTIAPEADKDFIQKNVLSHLTGTPSF